MDLVTRKQVRSPGYFSMMLSVGPFAQVIKDTTPELKKDGEDLHIRSG